MTPAQAAARLRDQYAFRTQADLNDIADLIESLQTQAQAFSSSPTVAHLITPSGGHQPAILIDRERAIAYAVRTHGVLSELIERKQA